jgi:hypothetical protein
LTENDLIVESIGCHVSNIHLHSLCVARKPES